jgi:hypothetical protein
VKKYIKVEKESGNMKLRENITKDKKRNNKTKESTNRGK